MGRGVVRILPWLGGALAAVALLPVSYAILPLLLVGSFVWIVLRRGPKGTERPADEEIAAWSSGAFMGFFCVLVAAAIVFLLAGLAPAVARAFPSLHTTLHRWSGVNEEVQLVARDDAFDTEEIVLPSGDATIRFTNLDVGVPHNVGIYSGERSTNATVYRGPMITGTSSVLYRFEVPAAGRYPFWCDVHPFMNGTLVVTAVAAPEFRSTGGILPSLAGRIAAASHGSNQAAERTGQRLVPAGQIAANYVFSAIMLLLAILLIRIRPRDWSARLLAIGMVGTAAVFNAQAHYAFDVIPSGYTDAAHDTFHIASGVAFMFGLLLFPDGQMVPRITATSPRAWLRWPLRLALAFAFAFAGLQLVSTFHGTDPGGYVAFFGIVIPIAGIVSQAFRYRNAVSESERQQSRLLVWALAIPLGATLVTAGLIAAVHALQGTRPTPADVSRIVFLLFPILFTIIPLMLVVVLVRYRLWDVERAISRTLVFGLLAAFISVVYVLIVVGIGNAIGTTGQENIPLSILATAIVAVAFDPLRRRLQQLANVLVYGRRASPYQVVTDFSRRISGSLSVDEVLPRMAEAAAAGVAADRTQVEVFLQDGTSRSATWPDGLAPDSFDRTIAVHHEGHRVGAIAVTKPEGEALTREEDGLLADLASQAGAAMRNVQLTAELQARLDQISTQATELRASQQRLVAAQDAAARRLERNLHDGAQQQLVAIAVTARLARSVAARDPERTEELLSTLQASASEALETIRDLARGIYPPLLADEGLVVALQAQIQKAALPATLEASDVGRYPLETEAAVYFCCLEAFQNVAKYAHASNVAVRLDGSGGALRFSVRDDGRGFDPDGTGAGSGTQNMADRLAALGGSLSIVSTPGQGTTVIGTLPLLSIAPLAGDG